MFYVKCEGIAEKYFAAEVHSLSVINVIIC
jgi:hypothetical protein